MTYNSISIDGPAGAGKGTIAKNLAKIINYKYIDTGAMYRTVALKVILCGFQTKDIEAVKSILNTLDYKVDFDENGQKNYLDNINVNDKIRSQECSQGASDVGTIREVRMKLVEIQREIAKNTNVIMEGRDIGTYVLPDSKVKIYLTASVEERARRRQKDFLAKGEDISLDEVIRTIEERDRQDSTREFAPLSIASDAIVVDTTNMSIDEVTEKIIEIIREKIDL